MEFKPHQYQHKAYRYLLEKQRCALFLGLGLGKTVISLTAIADLLDGIDVEKVLIVAPLRVARNTWANEINKWNHTRHLSYRVIKGTPAQRRRQVDGGEDIHVINYEQLVWLVNHFGASWPYDMIVFDEFSKLKSHKTKRFKAIRKILKFVDRIVGLTGTPASNGLKDLWAQTFILDNGYRLGNTFSAFQNRWFITDYMGYNITPQPWADEQIHDAISDICLSMSAEDYLEIPDVSYVEVLVDMPEQAVKTYKELEKEMYLEFESGEVTAMNAAVLTNKCRQLANGALYVGGSRETWQDIHDEKIEALADIIDEADTPVLVAYSFRSDLARLQNRFEQAQALDKNPETIDRWNAGEIPVLLTHSMSAAHGLNLQAGGRHAVWFGMEWSLELYQQFNGRLHRQGQTKPVFIHHIIAKNTVDEQVLKALQEKRSVQDILLEALKEAA